jgi:hypothetical protein
LIAKQRLRPPFAGLAVVADQARPRHLHRLGAERADDLTFPAPVAVALRTLGGALVSPATERSPQFLLEDRFYETANPLANPVLKRVECAITGQ